MNNFRSRFSGRSRVSVSFDKGTGRTKSSFKDECDVNKIVSRYQKTGQLPSLIKNNPRYGDFASVPDFQDALNLVAHAQEQFAALPSRVRAECYNDPAVFLDRVQDPAWVETHSDALKGVKAGLIEDKPAPGVGVEDPKKVSKEPKESTTK